MSSCFNPSRAIVHLAAVLLMCLFLQGCASHRGAQLQWNARSQVVISEASQVRLRSMQTRTFEAADKTAILRAAVAVMQDLFFTIEVLDEDLGVVSGKKLCNVDSVWEDAFAMENGWDDHPSYFLYETDDLLAFKAMYLTWGPFDYRNDLARLTITVRPKSQTDFLVRASMQFNLRAVEDLTTYQRFFKLLGNAMFIANQT